MWRKLTVGSAVLVYGFAWGLSELFLGSYLHTIHYPGKGWVLGGIGMTILARFAVRYRSLRYLPQVGLVAAGTKLFSAVVYGLPLLSRAVVNPVAAIMTETLAATVATLGAAAWLRYRETRLQKAE